VHPCNRLTFYSHILRPKLQTRNGRPRAGMPSSSPSLAGSQHWRPQAHPPSKCSTFIGPPTSSRRHSALAQLPLPNPRPDPLDPHIWPPKRKTVRLLAFDCSMLMLMPSPGVAAKGPARLRLNARRLLNTQALSMPFCARTWHATRQVRFLTLSIFSFTAVLCRTT
jgi:hypothetical protein